MQNKNDKNKFNTVDYIKSIGVKRKDKHMIHWYVLQENMFQGLTLDECYDSYSIHKSRAYDCCLNISEKLDYHFRGILTFNSQVFTYGITFYNYETDTTYFVVITKNGLYYCDIPTLRSLREFTAM